MYNAPLFENVLISDEPVAGCSPPELLKAGKLFPSEEDFSLLHPYLEYVIQDCLVTHIPELKQFKKDVRYVYSNCIPIIGFLHLAYLGLQNTSIL